MVLCPFCPRGRRRWCDWYSKRQRTPLRTAMAGARISTSLPACRHSSKVVTLLKQTTLVARSVSGSARHAHVNSITSDLCMSTGMTSRLRRCLHASSASLRPLRTQIPRWTRESAVTTTAALSATITTMATVAVVVHCSHRPAASNSPLCPAPDGAWGEMRRVPILGARLFHF